MATRWAICGTGKIASDFCLCLKSLPSSEHQIVAVGSSDKAKAENFAAQFGIPKSYGSYEELAHLTDVDVVYVTTLHTKHVELSLLYINAGKNVLCEKPMSMSLAGCQKVLTAAKEKGVLFVEAFWTRFFPAYKFIQEQIQSGAIGEVKVVEATFVGNMLHWARMADPELGGGGLLDPGCYTVQAANLFLKGKPEKVISDVSKTEVGVDKSGVILLRYPGDKFASLVYSLECSAGANALRILGTKGTIVIPDFYWCPTEVVLPNHEVKKFTLPDVKDSDKFNFWNCQGLTYEAQGVRDCLLKGLKESPTMPYADSETIMYIIQEVFNQHGIKYKFQ